jgi:prepilin-type N-terminal cleavage/methylation domain-containing protein
MLKLIQKRNNKKGFTLAELLIVVAIIAVLVAISIPIFSAQLRKAKVATDQANARAGKAAAVAAALEAQSESDLTYYYDAKQGVVKDATKAADIKPYGKTSDVKTDDNIEGATDGQNLTQDVVKIVIKPDNTVTVTWEAPGK